MIEFDPAPKPENGKAESDDAAEATKGVGGLSGAALEIEGITRPGRPGAGGVEADGDMPYMAPPGAAGGDTRTAPKFDLPAGRASALLGYSLHPPKPSGEGVDARAASPTDSGPADAGSEQATAGPERHDVDREAAVGEVVSPEGLGDDKPLLVAPEVADGVHDIVMEYPSDSAPDGYIRIGDRVYNTGPGYSTHGPIHPEAVARPDSAPKGDHVVADPDLADQVGTTQSDAMAPGTDAPDSGGAGQSQPQSGAEAPTTGEVELWTEGAANFDGRPRTADGVPIVDLTVVNDESSAAADTEAADGSENSHGYQGYADSRAGQDYGVGFGADDYWRSPGTGSDPDAGDYYEWRYPDPSSGSDPEAESSGYDPARDDSYLDYLLRTGQAGWAGEDPEGYDEYSGDPADYYGEEGSKAEVIFGEIPPGDREAAGVPAEFRDEGFDVHEVRGNLLEAFWTAVRERVDAVTEYVGNRTVERLSFIDPGLQDSSRRLELIRVSGARNTQYFMVHGHRPIEGAHDDRVTTAARLWNRAQGTPYEPRHAGIRGLLDVLHNYRAATRLTDEALRERALTFILARRHHELAELVENADAAGMGGMLRDMRWLGRLVVPR